MKEEELQGEEVDFEKEFEEYFKRRPCESYELAFFKGLRAKYPPADMSVLDIAVCVEIYINKQIDEHPSHYDEIVARLMHETLEYLPRDAWPEFMVEARKHYNTDGFTSIENSINEAYELVQMIAVTGLEGEEGGGEKGEIGVVVKKMNKFKLFRVKKDAARAIANAHQKGFVQYELHEWGIAERPGDCKEFIWVPTVDVKLRDDIFEEMVEIDRRLPN